MYRTPSYILLFIVMALLQIFLFNNLSISSYFAPLVYLVFLIMLPLELPPIAMLGLGLLTGVTMDTTMGIAGLNTIVSLAIVFARPYWIRLLTPREDMRDEGIPSRGRLGKRLFWSYAVGMVLIHHTLFFLLESLSWAHLPGTLLRILLSSIGTLFLVGVTERIFVSHIKSQIL